jgi:hypothetical protein
MSVTGVQATRQIGWAAPLAYVVDGSFMDPDRVRLCPTAGDFQTYRTCNAIIGKTLGPLAGFVPTGTPASSSSSRNKRSESPSFSLATIATLSLLVVYALVSVGAARLRVLAPRRPAVRGMVQPIGRGRCCSPRPYRSLVLAPAFPCDLFPNIVAAWFVAGLTLTPISPTAADRVREGLALS